MSTHKNPNLMPVHSSLPAIPFAVINNLHGTIVRTRVVLEQCDKHLDQLQSALALYLYYGNGLAGDLLFLTYDVLRDYLLSVASYMPVVAQLGGREDRFHGLVEATLEVMNCLLHTLMYTDGGEKEER